MATKPNILSVGNCLDNLYQDRRRISPAGKFNLSEYDIKFDKLSVLKPIFRFVLSVFYADDIMPGEINYLKHQRYAGDGLHKNMECYLQDGRVLWFGSEPKKAV